MTTPRLIALMLAALAMPTLATPASVLYWDMDTAVAAEQLSYAEQALALTLQGLINRDSPTQKVMFKAGFLDFDWPKADPWWRQELESAGRATFSDVSPTLCGLVQAAEPLGVFDGLVLYESAMPTGAGYTMPLALTLAGQEALLPALEETRMKHACLARLPVRRDLRLAGNPQLETREKAWRWAAQHLLPNASSSSVYNLYHFDKNEATSSTDPQSNATVASLDVAVYARAFVVDLRPDDAGDAALLAEILGALGPLFDAYGWAHNEHAWTEAVSRAGGVVFCSFASPNLSFWATLALPDGVARARKLPSGDTGRRLDRSKYYVTFETNEGDTPRIISSAFGSSWASPQRGSVPVAWSVDPVLSERFPALMDYYAMAAKANDSFIGGVAGAGYVYLGALTDEQLGRYAKRTGELYKRYGPSVADTYGQANLSTIAKYSAAAAEGGMAPVAYVAQPLWARGAYAQDAWRCPELNLYSPHDGAPIICTANKPSLFYRNAGLNATHPGADLAARIRNVSKRYEPPFFITVYGGLNWQPGSTGGKTEFWALLHSTMAILGNDYVGE
jgi:hypothetical protein